MESRLFILIIRFHGENQRISCYSLFSLAPFVPHLTLFNTFDTKWSDSGHLSPPGRVSTARVAKTKAQGIDHLTCHSPRHLSLLSEIPEK